MAALGNLLMRPRGPPPPGSPTATATTSITHPPSTINSSHPPTTHAAPRRAGAFAPPPMPATTVEGPIGSTYAFPIDEAVVNDIEQEWVVEGTPRTIATEEEFSEIMGCSRAEFAGWKAWKQKRTVG